MALNSILYAGTSGQGVWRSVDNGETFQRRCAGMFMEAEVRALEAHPSRPGVLYAGTDAGLYRTENGGERWNRLNTPFDPGTGWPSGVTIWSLLLHPKDPDLLFVGTCPSGLYRSRDAGETWEKLNAALTPECAPIVYSRVTCLRADPRNEKRIWAGIEIDGAWRSDDGGDSWRRMAEGLSSPDIHDIAILPGSPTILLAATNNDLNISRDEGATWQPRQVKEIFPFAYCRALTMKTDDPTMLLLGNGNGPPGPCRPIVQSGHSLQPRRTPVSSSAPPLTATCTGAKTEPPPGTSARTNSARCARWL